ncbi:hypothetical protein BT69DRAFT_1295979 [Atractiella rhizophila]|nr:hypothetical protein BT69DRAFT_1295979 [Atractiella rhizophila]
MVAPQLQVKDLLDTDKGDLDLIERLEQQGLPTNEDSVIRGSKATNEAWEAANIINLDNPALIAFMKQEDPQKALEGQGTEQKTAKKVDKAGWTLQEQMQIFLF